jgi:hypothetical protein
MNQHVYPLPPVTAHVLRQSRRAYEVAKTDYDARVEMAVAALGISSARVVALDLDAPQPSITLETESPVRTQHHTAGRIFDAQPEAEP